MNVARKKILTWDELAREVSRRKREGQRIVFTNGCFDLLHVGHARYLQQARALGDCLIVGLNSDESVRALKGPNRPLIPAEERAEMLAALECVDAVAIFPQRTPDALIRLVAPHVHVKGGDYRKEDLPEAALVEALGGEVRIVPLVEGRSTSEIVLRILERYR
ncbi:MAG TPA: D-glycero-beta-D-manno-heptose 1-phosphate adenylyltransferase [Armatimonadota bacterium]|nr:D-glycero-beta-D-manno-heptose 1-phosphate adenylyltransferase [Armatimonadota bacterium]HPO71650.1 D-glycero-beta-D-manno-heptose 1-phosphate adenylyltransferase [Armatimonadota bacterium]HPT96649.1 D-glycero-beta-D-manno-heptose 1-phosphate adenylyltransferase [Armatimonadota bacterium]